MSRPTGLTGPVGLACTRTGLYLVGRPADLLTTLRRLTDSLAASQPASPAPLTLQRLLDAVAPPV